MFKKEIGEIIPGLEINGKPAPYGVLNEKAVRKNALTVFILGTLVFIYTFITRDFFIFSIFVPILWLDFFLKVFFGPKYSFFSRFANFLVKKQKPEYVGAKQKRFAWLIGFIMSSITIYLVLLLGITCGLPMFLCLLCLTFMFAEAFYGYCVGCTIYVFLRDKGIIKKEKFAPVCANGACEIKNNT